MALDRIEEIKPIKAKYEECEIDFKEYFEDIIGVSKPNGAVPIKIELFFSREEAPYILTKPLHGSQKKIIDDEHGLLISIEVIPNYELEKLLLSFGERVTIQKPKGFKQALIDRINLAMKNYSIQD